MKPSYNFDVCQSLLRSRFSSARVLGERRYLQLLLCLFFLFLVVFFSLGVCEVLGFFVYLGFFGGASEAGHWVGMLLFPLFF